MIYLFPEMIELGLKKGEKFPSKAHRTVAVNLAICNPMVGNCDMMVTVVSAVNKVPKNRIKKITYSELRNEFGLPPILVI